MKNVLFGVVSTLVAVAAGLYIGQEIVDYIQYRQALQMMEAIIAL